MKGSNQKVVAALLALALAGVYGSAFAGADKSSGYSGTTHQSTPKDCVKNPNDPRCKKQ